jgi:predicted dehydrogenase
MVRVRFVGPGRIWVLRLGSWLVFDAECFVSVQDCARNLRLLARQAAKVAVATAATSAVAAMQG